jgi:hypothetical protein
LELLLEKHGAPAGLISGAWGADPIGGIREWMLGASSTSLASLVDELVQTSGAVRFDISPKYRFDERWKEFQGCVELDGYRIVSDRVSEIEPTIQGVSPIEDELNSELDRSGLSNADEIKRLLDRSARAYVAGTPDYNACLGEARVALETTARSIAAERHTRRPGSYDPSKWGQIVAYLRTSGLIDGPEENGLTGVYALISPGSHRSVGITECEFARLGRSLANSITYFLVKRFNGDARA